MRSEMESAPFFEIADDMAAATRWVEAEYLVETQSFRAAAAARADYIWCVRARLIDASANGSWAFLMGYLSMEKFFQFRQILPELMEGRHPGIRPSDVIDFAE